MAMSIALFADMGFWDAFKVFVERRQYAAVSAKYDADVVSKMATDYGVVELIEELKFEVAPVEEAVSPTTTEAEPEEEVARVDSAEEAEKEGAVSSSPGVSTSLPPWRSKPKPPTFSPPTWIYDAMDAEKDEEPHATAESEEGAVSWSPVVSASQFQRKPTQPPYSPPTWIYDAMDAEKDEEPHATAEAEEGATSQLEPKPPPYSPPTWLLENIVRGRGINDEDSEDLVPQDSEDLVDEIDDEDSEDFVPQEGFWQCQD